MRLLGIWFKKNKRRLYLGYVQIEAWRNRGAGWISTFYSWASIGAMKDAFLIGGIAKLTVFKDLPIMWFMFIIFILGIIAEVVKIWIGHLDWKYGIAKIQNEWSQKHNINNPFNTELRATLENICKKVGAKSKFEDY